MINLCIRLFGKFSAKANDVLVEGLEGSKVQELFGYLLCHRDRPHSRERLADTLWNHCQAGHPRKYLRQALWQLQGAMSKLYSSETPPFLNIDSDWIQLNSHACLWLDVAEFEQACHCCENRAGAQLTDSQAEALKRALEIYRGELLEGCYQDWCLYERERLHHLYLTILYRLLTDCETRLDCETGIQIGCRILHCDRASEKTHRQMMRLHCLAGDRTAALRQYAQCCQALDEELGVKPSKATVALYEQIRADNFDPTAGAGGSAAISSGAPPTGIAETLGFLLTVQELLKNVQWQVERGIKSVEGAARGQKNSNRH